MVDEVLRARGDTPQHDSPDGTVGYPPAPLHITLPAEPASLALGRGRLREWLTAAGLDTEVAADILLAAGEATANATEHAILGAGGSVDITLDARISDGTLRLRVSDNGSWRPATLSGDHRGHGLHLMEALMDSVELTAGPQGTTVAMIKELKR